MALNLGNRKFTADDFRRYLLAYNTGYYPPARASNVEADDNAYRLFAGGLAHDLPTLTRQLRFIGKDFGGAKVIKFDRVSTVIAERILAADAYHEVIAAQPSMEAGPVHPTIVQELINPFLNLPPELGQKRNFGIWASKVLHFARLDAFPVLDSAARTALGLPASVTYPNYVDRYRLVFLTALDDLRAAGNVDPSSPTLLRRFDKILYQIGLELKGSDGSR